MKKLKIFGCLFFIASLNIAGTNNHVDNVQDTIKDNPKLTENKASTDSKKIENYRKATDSLLTVTKITNIKSEKDLNEIKKYNQIYDTEDKKIENYKNEISKSLNLLIKKFEKERNQTKNLSTQLKSKENHSTKKDEIYIKDVDSVLVKGNLFRKERWDYILIFSNGTKKRLKNKL